MEFWGCIFIVCLGTAGHFLYEWLNHTRLAGLLFAVNESTWEHIKLAIYPSVLWFAVELASRGFSYGAIIAQAASLLTMVLLIPCFFYGYTSLTHKNWLVCDILCFIASIVVGMWVFSLVLKAAPCSEALLICSLIVLAAILTAYFIFTYHAPHCFLFRDPITGGFGPEGHGCHEHYHHTSDCGCK